MAGSFAAVNLFKKFKKRLVVDDVSLSVNTGEIVGLLGPNGAGKSTTFYMMVGRILPDSGRVTINGREAGSMPMYARARLGIGYLPQEPSIFRDLSVLNNIKLVLRASRLDPKTAEAECERLIEEMGLSRIAGIPGYALSGGERRRVEIARCLATRPDFILLDEPFSGIDPVAVYHNVRETLAITDRTYLMYQWKIFLEGPPEVIANDPTAKKYYLGERFEW